MAIAFSGLTPINTVFISNGTRSQLLTQMENALVAAGWNPISGAGSSDWIYESGVTPQGLKIRLEGIDPGTGNCAKFRLRTGPSFNLTAQDWFMCPVNTTPFRIWANKYQFFFFTSGVANTNRSLVCGGVPYIWPFMVFVLSGSPWCGWSHGNGQIDTDTTTLTNTFRRAYSLAQSGGPLNFSCIWTETVQTNLGSSGIFGLLTLCPQGSLGTTAGFQYEDGSWSLNEPILCWPTGVSIVGPAVTRHGQIWDCALISKVYTSEDIRSIAGNNWMNITHNNSINIPPGSILLLTP